VTGSMVVSHPGQGGNYQALVTNAQRPLLEVNKFQPTVAGESPQYSVPPNPY
jgi:hypothetical protein